MLDSQSRFCCIEVHIVCLPTQNDVINNFPRSSFWFCVLVPFPVSAGHVCVGPSDFTCVISMLMFVISFCCLVVVSIVLPPQNRCEWNFFVFLKLFSYVFFHQAVNCDMVDYFWNSIHSLCFLVSLERIKLCSHSFADFLLRRKFEHCGI